MYAAKFLGSLSVSTEFTASAQNHRPTLPEPSLPIDRVYLDPEAREPGLGGRSFYPPGIYLGVKHGILTPKFLGNKYFLVHTLTESTL